MTSVHDSREDQIAREATGWLNRLQDPSGDAKEAFAEWITRSSDHVHQFLLATAVLEEVSHTLGYGVLGGIAVAADSLPADSMPVEVEFIARAVARLPEPWRRALTLRKVYGCSRKEIADRLHLDEDTVEQQLCHATRRLAGMLPDSALSG
jgi:DNA-directed RNA polymerase specialized sigma24 family protein